MVISTDMEQNVIRYNRKLHGKGKFMTGGRGQHESEIGRIYAKL